MKTLLTTVGAIFLLILAPLRAQETAPILPAPSEIFTVGVFKPSGSNFFPEFQFDAESFLKVYPSFIPAKVEIPVGAKFAWQNGVIVTKEKKVLFWRTCDKRFIMIDTPEGTRTYGVSDKISLFDRIPQQ